MRMRSKFLVFEIFLDVSHDDEGGKEFYRENAKVSRCLVEKMLQILTWNEGSEGLFDGERVPVRLRGRLEKVPCGDTRRLALALVSVKFCDISEVQITRIRTAHSASASLSGL